VETKIKAGLDARDTPIELFGTGAAARTRKLVFLTIALWANPDGTQAFPSMNTISTACGLTVRGVRDVIGWLAGHHLLDVVRYGSERHTNLYVVRLSDEARSDCRAELERDQEQISLQAKAEQTRLARSEAAKARWAAKTSSANGERSVPSNPEHSVPSELGTQRSELTRNPLHDNPEPVASEPGTRCIQPGTQRSYNRPYTVLMNRPNEPSIQPSSKNGRSDGWLDQRLTSILSIKTDRAMATTKAEHDGLWNLTGVYGELAVALGFYHFLDRDRGLEGVDYPISLFVAEAPTWITRAQDEMADHTAGALADATSALRRAYPGNDWFESDAAALCELAYLHSELEGTDNYAMGAMTDYLEHHSADGALRDFAFLIRADEQAEPTEAMG